MTTNHLEGIIKACKEAEALGWKSIDFFARNESDADAVEKTLKNANTYEYTRRRTNFEIKWVENNQNNFKERNEQENVHFDNLREQFLNLFGL